jgi:hypothetical protein
MRRAHGATRPQKRALIDRAIDSGRSWESVANAVDCAPEHLRQVIGQVAVLRWNGTAPADLARTAPRAPLPPLPRRQLSTIKGSAAEPDVWTAGWRWSSFSPDALADLADGAWQPHLPVPVLYRHLGDARDALGFTRHLATRRPRP